MAQRANPHDAGLVQLYCRGRGFRTALTPGHAGLDPIVDLGFDPADGLATQWDGSRELALGLHSIDGSAAKTGSIEDFGEADYATWCGGAHSFSFKTQFRSGL